ncbi:MAG TPA: zf-TFIIB domain-containing protein [Verrucomicrobiae bacterium]|nr:zf-TFIIB domain-containing protein [Verrucomicrobiae bacterium]
MKCPSCKNPLLEKDAGGMTLDICYGGCGGIWFDATELERVTPRAAATLHTIWSAPVSSEKLAEPRMCPRCPELELERKWFSELKQVEIDQCKKCGGIWLDAGEFTRIYGEIKGGKVTSPGWANALAEATKLVEQKLAETGQPKAPDV